MYIYIYTHGDGGGERYYIYIYLLYIYTYISIYPSIHLSICMHTFEKICMIHWVQLPSQFSFDMHQKPRRPVPSWVAGDEVRPFWAFLGHLEYGTCSGNIPKFKGIVLVLGCSRCSAHLWDLRTHIPIIIYKLSWLVVWNMYYVPIYWVGIIIPIDEYFSVGWKAPTSKYHRLPS